MMIATLLVAAAAVFSAAKPVWVEGETETMNTFFRFKTTFEAASAAVLKVSAGYNYRVKLNGKFIGYGPIRAPEGYAFVDEWRLPTAAGGNLVELESAGYNCNSYYMLDQPPFLVAELSVDGKVVAATGKDGGFRAYPTGRVRKVQRFSYQRTFLESYVVNDAVEGDPLPLVEMPSKRWLGRPVAYPDFARSVFHPLSLHRLALDPKRKGGSLWHVNGCADLKMYRKDELTTDPFDELSRYVTVARNPVDAAAASVRLAAGEQAVYEGAIDESGFIGVTVSCDAPCRVLVTFDELLDGNGDINFRRLGCGDIIEWKLEKGGTHVLESFEPYAGKYVGVMVMDGAAEVTDVAVRTYKSPAADRAAFRASDPALEKIFLAARESFRANAVDSLTDCPIRERSCWTGDTFFTGRGAAWLTGEPSSERLFLENFLMPEKFDWSHYKTKGRDYSDTIPALYPGSIYGDNFISNYTMWFILQVEEHVRRYGDREFAERFRPRILRMVEFLRQFRNADGLLEKLPGWVFVEWSKANELVQDVNYPSSMMYAAALDAVARMYGLSEYAEDARRMKREIVRQSWTGEWFCDNAVRQPDGTLKLSGECTETCQYCAFFFGTVTPESHPDLWKRLLDEFGPDRVAKGVHKRIWSCNFIFGTCERLELLSRAGRSGQILSETRDFFLKMAERTGTLWEHLDTRASCCHGFSCIASEYLFRDILGVRAVDRAAKTVRFAPPKDVNLEWCEGVLPLSATETASFRWTRTLDGPKPTCVLPSGWKADLADLAAERAPSATERLRERLLEIGRSDKFVYSWSTASSKWTEKGFDTFRQQTGVSPIFYFCEFRDIGGTWYSPELYARHREIFAALVKREYRQRGAIPLVTWHLQNPYTPPEWSDDYGPNQAMRYRYSSKGYPQEHRYVLREIAEGTGSLCGTGRIDGVNAKAFPNPRAWYEWVLKDVTSFWRTVRDDAGRPIPIIFRFFHEMDGDWFWWGPGSATPKDFIATFRLTVDIVRKELGAENVLFCYGPDKRWSEPGEEGKSGYLRWYPGDAYVDMLSIDDYSIGKSDTAKTTEGALRRLRIISSLGRERNKICAIAECGARGSSDDFYTIIHRLMTSPGVDFAIATTYDGPWTFPETEAGKADMRKFFRRPEVLSGDARELFR